MWSPATSAAAPWEPRRPSQFQERGVLGKSIFCVLVGYRGCDHANFSSTEFHLVQRAGFTVFRQPLEIFMHSSQNEQDSRLYARAARIALVEPSDSQECLDFMKDLRAGRARIGGTHPYPGFIRAAGNGFVA